MKYHSRTVLNNDGGVNYDASIVRTLIHNGIGFMCDPLDGATEFTVQEQDRRNLDTIIKHLDSMRGHEIPYEEDDG